MSFPASRVAGRLGRWLLRLVIFAILILVFAYGGSRLGVFEWPRKYDPLALPDLTEPPSLLTHWQMKLVDASPQNCTAVLSEAGVPASLKPDRAERGECGKWGAMELSRLSSARIRPEDMRCAIAARLYMWERHVVQPAARRYLGEQVTQITHFGSYQCRNMRGSNSLSEHATANAFDISGFKTSSGKTISLLKDWNGNGPEQRFLHAVHEGLCEWFNLTLGPNYNADHKDHFHVDMGTWRSCR